MFVKSLKTYCSLAQKIVQIFVFPWTAACQASLSFTVFIQINILGMIYK